MLGHRGVVEALVSWGVDLEARDEKDYTALAWAASNGHAEVLSPVLFDARLLCARPSQPVYITRRLQRIHRGIVPHRYGCMASVWPTESLV
jgi:ankyrin repeat protein